MVAPEPIRKTPDSSVDTALSEPRMAKPAEERPPQMMAMSPRRDSSAPSWVSPTLRTSAAATPSG